ncbi:hypothetical protein LC612_23160 [Nostoc sp. CHAB 5834]|nr:hypothetical protein [Nostoc sp. CHAB 5834]
MQKIVGFLGAKKAGKDTAAAVLIEELGFRRESFARELYRQVADAFDVSVEDLNQRETKELPAERFMVAKCRDPGFMKALQRFVPEFSTPEAFFTPQSPRALLQWWGTEYRRKSGVDSYWIDIVRKEIEANPDVNYVITDVRFPNEHRLISSMRGFPIRIRNLEVEEQEHKGRISANALSLHESETALDAFPVAMEIFNEFGKLHEFRERVRQVTKLFD